MTVIEVHRFARAAEQPAPPGGASGFIGEEVVRARLPDGNRHSPVATSVRINRSSRRVQRDGVDWVGAPIGDRHPW